MPSLLAEQSVSSGIVQEPDNVSDPVRAVEVIHHREDLHARVLRLQKWHHAIIYWQCRATLHEVEILIRLIVDALQSSVGGEHVQPVGIKNVDLMGIAAQRRKTGRFPRNVERSPNSFALIQLDLRSRQLGLAVRAGRNLLLAVAGLFLLAFFECLEGALLRREKKFR